MIREQRVIGGVDEAGRGCVLGPLVVAGVSIPSSRARAFRKLGVKDSKKLSARQREALYPKIIEMSSQVHWVAITPQEIDEVVIRGRRLRKLNYLEAVYFARVIDKLQAPRVTVDASDIVPERFRDDIVANLTAKCRVIALHKADRDYPVVSAASIVAKVQRDRAVEVLRRAHGDFGSGYPSDPVTRSYFIEKMKEGAPLPDYVRKSWKTWLHLEQTMLDAF
jgi:ribonuclease HII